MARISYDDQTAGAYREVREIPRDGQGARWLADVGRQVLIGRDQLIPPRLGVAALAPGEVGGQVLGVDLPPGPEEGDRV
jgi:hypothetical protein